MTDNIVRLAFHRSILKSQHESADVVVVDELGLKNGLIRADIAVLNGKLIGYEIKTNSDNLSRLPNQIKAYNEVFDKIYIITGDKHLQSVLEYVPEWWGIFLITDCPTGSYNFKRCRKAKKNNQRNAFGIAQLLWKDEVVEILTCVLKNKLKSKVTKEELYEALSNKYTPSRLSSLVLKYLKSRQTWRTSRSILS
jgi:hypothetical protein